MGMILSTFKNRPWYVFLYMKEAMLGLTDCDGIGPLGEHGIGQYAVGHYVA